MFFLGVGCTAAKDQRGSATMPGEINGGGGDKGASSQGQELVKTPLDIRNARPRCRHGFLKPRPEDILMYEPEEANDVADGMVIGGISEYFYRSRCSVELAGQKCKVSVLGIVLGVWRCW